MTQPGLIGPSADSWIASIHAGKPDDKPVGAAVVVDARRVLTCALVVIDSGEVRQPLWVSFPKSDAADDDWRLVTSVDWIYDPPAADVAILMLNQDVPVGVESASLRRPRPNDLAGRRWWAFGFPDGDAIGDCADGLIGAALARGWVRLDTGSKYLVRRGFSGAGLWSPDYGAVVGIVGQANFNGDGRAITLYRIHQMLPAQDLELLTAWSVRAAGHLALEDWGWSLSDDPEGVRHWRPRARGVTVESELGYRFRGRIAGPMGQTALNVPPCSASPRLWRACKSATWATRAHRMSPGGPVPSDVGP